jgi:poly(ADP-ribose) glycohydrolase ARH3
MTKSSETTLQSIVTEYYLRQGRRHQRNWVVTNISLPHCRGFVQLSSRLDREVLATSAPQIFRHIYDRIRENFKVINTTRDTVQGQSRVILELENDAAIYITFSDTEIKLEGSSKKRIVSTKIRQCFNDLKLQLTREMSIEQLAELFHSAKRHGRITAGKIISEIADERFIAQLRRQVFSDRSAPVRREALKALAQLQYLGRKTDLIRAKEDGDEAVHTIATAFLHGNRFKLEQPQISFPAKTRAVGKEHKVAGTLLGAAVGDMMGRPLEFWTRSEIEQQFGSPVEDLVVSTNPQIPFGQFSDDTQLMIMTAEAIDYEFGFSPDHFACLLAEHVFQIDTNGIPNHGYGAATMRSGRYLYYGIPWARSGTNASTCGPTLRVAPLAVYYQRDWQTLREVVLTASGITHKAAPAIAGALAIAFSIARLISMDQETEPAEVVSWAAGLVRRYDSIMADRIELAARLALDREIYPSRAYEILGNGSESMETVPMAFYAFLKTPDNYQKTIITAINAGGDADSIGAIAGALSGAYNGIDHIPQQWLGYMRDSSLVYAAINRLIG